MKRELLLVVSVFALSLMVAVAQRFPWAWWNTTSDPVAVGLMDNLFAYWTFDETTGIDRADSVGTNTIYDRQTNAPYTTNGIVGNAVDYITDVTPLPELSAATNLQVGNFDWTITLWVKFSAVAGAQYVYGIWGDSEGDDSFLLFNPGGGGNLDWYGRFASGLNNVSLASVGAPVTNQWYFFALGYYTNSTSGNYWALVNGTNWNASVFTNVLPSGNNKQWTVGNKVSTPTQSTDLDGIIDEAGYWKRRLTSNEVVWLYNNSTGRTCCPFQ